MVSRVIRVAGVKQIAQPFTRDFIDSFANNLPVFVDVIPNASDLNLLHPDLDGADARQRLGLGNRFVAIYFGAMGIANGLDYVIEAARILNQRRNGNISIVLHGDGGQRLKLERMAQIYKLDNIVFSSPVQEKSEIKNI